MIRILILMMIVAIAHPAIAADLPEPGSSKTKFSKVIGWPEGKTPQAPPGFLVTKFASDLANPRNIYVASNGDIFVAEAATKIGAVKKLGAKMIGADKAQNFEGGNRILLFRDTDNDGTPDDQRVFIDGLNQPFGMLVLDNWFYVANTDALWRYPYQAGADKPSGVGEKILDLPAGGYNNHWTRNLLSDAAGKKIFISVGSGSNIAEYGMDNELRRAAILEINPDGTNEKIYAGGLRNPVGLALSSTGDLWTAVNERDGLGDDLVPDYLTSVRQGGFYGWPYSYWGQHVDGRVENRDKDLIAKAIVPDVDLGSHTASLGLAFYSGENFPVRYRSGAFIGQHGSWNRSQLAGYKVVFVPFKDGKALVPPEDFLTGFIKDADKGEVYGRPVGVAMTQDGALLVADDAANTIWHVMFVSD